MSIAPEISSIVLRDIDLISEMRVVETLQKEIWECDDRDIAPLTIIAATLEVGGILVGAFAGSTLVGFAYGFIGREDGETVHHSHMLAVKPSYRGFDIGHRLKLAQRERALAQGITRMNWTFDPLQSLNAYFNFNKLGVLADQFKVNFYGETTSSSLHRIGTDRLWVSWMLDSPRVHERLETAGRKKDSRYDLESIASLVGVGANDAPLWNGSPEILSSKRLMLEIPRDINTLQREDPELGMRWREATRKGFTEALAAGYLVEEFYRASRNGQPVGMYLLGLGKSVAHFF
ncbi:MAG: GNAT family N-acetyltransferase [Pyrinomonadaceae bacterium]